MSRSHMMHPSSLSSTQQPSFPSPTGDTSESGQDTDNLTTSEPPLPQITSVASLQHIVPDTDAIPLSTTSLRPHPHHHQQLPFPKEVQWPPCIDIQAQATCLPHLKLLGQLAHQIG